MNERNVIAAAILAGAAFVVVVRSCTDSPQRETTQLPPAATSAAVPDVVALRRADLLDESSEQGSQNATEHHTLVGQAIALSKSHPERITDEASQRSIARGRAAIARTFNKRLRTIALNELPFTSEIAEIRKPIWGCVEDEVLVGVSVITYLTDGGKTLVALATCEGGKWTISQHDDWNLLDSPKQNADALMIVTSARLRVKLDVPD